MPLAVRYVEPLIPSGMPLLDAVQSNHLQALNVQSLTGVIRQLASLAKHAEDIMGNIADMLGSFHGRTVVLEERTRRLREEVLPRLDADQEVLEGFEIPHPDFQFRSDQTVGQHLFTRQTVPPTLNEQITGAWSPDLHVFTSVWEDGRNGMHMYSNPDFFFEHWRINIQRETMRRRTNVDVLSPTHVDDRLPNGSIKQEKSKKEKEQFKRGGLSRSFRRRTRQHGSTLSLQEVGVKQGGRKSNFTRSFSVRKPPSGGSLRASFRRKTKTRPKLEDLSKATAAAFEGPEITLAIPETALEEDQESPAPGSKLKRNSFIRRSFSLRRSRSRSRSPNPPIPAQSILKGMPMHTLEAEKEKVDTSKLSTLSKRHLENLELGTSNFETCLSVDSSRKNSSTFKASVAIQSRSISPMDLQPRRELFPPPKVAPRPVRVSSQSESGNLDQSLQPPRHRASTISSLGPEANGTAKDVRSVDARPASVVIMEHQRDMIQTSGIPPRPLSVASQSSLFSRTQSPASQMVTPSQQSPVEMLTGSNGTGGVPQTRPKPRRPAPPRPTKNGSITKQHNGGSPLQLAPNLSPVSGPPPPPPRGDSLSATKSSEVNATPPISPPSSTSLFSNDPPALSSTLAMNPLHASPFSIPEDTGAPTSFGGIPFISAAAVTPSTFHAQTSRPKPRAPLLKQGSLYISPRKQSIMDFTQLTLTVPGADGTDNKDKLRASQILHAGGVSNSDMSSDRDDLLAAIRKGLQLKKVEKEEQEKKKASEAMPWDVAAILERRLAIESDSEGSEEGIDDVEWED